MTDSEPEILQLPMGKPVCFNEADGKLLITIPASLRPDITAVDRFARTLLKDRRVKVQCRTIETEFLINQFEERPDLMWDGIVIVNYILPDNATQQVTHSLDMPGPIYIKPIDFSLDGLTIMAWYE